jgi:hypothetical protein
MPVSVVVMALPSMTEAWSRFYETISAEIYGQNL